MRYTDLVKYTIFFFSLWLLKAKLTSNNHKLVDNKNS